jgi:hypothetical protein
VAPPLRTKRRRPWAQETAPRHTRLRRLAALFAVRSCRSSIATLLKPPSAPSETPAAGGRPGRHRPASRRRFGFRDPQNPSVLRVGDPRDPQGACGSAAQMLAWRRRRARAQATLPVKDSSCDRLAGAQRGFRRSTPSASACRAWLGRVVREAGIRGRRPGRSRYDARLRRHEAVPLRGQDERGCAAAGAGAALQPTRARPHQLSWRRCRRAVSAARGRGNQDRRCAVRPGLGRAPSGCGTWTAKTSSSCAGSSCGDALGRASIC